MRIKYATFGQENAGDISGEILINIKINKVSVAIQMSCSILTIPVIALSLYLSYMVMQPRVVLF